MGLLVGSRPLPMTLFPLMRLSGHSRSQETKWSSVFHLLISHRLEFGGGASEPPYRLAISAWRYCYVVGFVADINATSVGMDHFQAEVFALHLPHHLPS